MASSEIIRHVLDPETEPTDEPLARLMRLVGDEARARKIAAKQCRRETAVRETAAASASLNFPAH